VVYSIAMPILSDVEMQSLTVGRKGCCRQPDLDLGVSVPNRAAKSVFFIRDFSCILRLPTSRKPIAPFPLTSFGLLEIGFNDADLS
jgi:hypothetical protein